MAFSFSDSQPTGSTTPAPEDLFERVLHYQDQLISAFTGSPISSEDYSALRNDLMNNPAFAGLFPDFLKRNRDTGALWSFAKSVSPSWEPRRQFIRESFAALLDHLERSAPVAALVSEGLSRLDAEHVQRLWEKALARCPADPDGAVTAARTLVESTCKLILEATGSNAKVDDLHDLPKLYRKTADQLSLSPSQHSEDAFKRILGGCASVVEGLGTLRNKVGDAHGQGKRAVKPQPRHAFLAVNLAGAMALFLVETWAAKNAVGD